MEQDLGKSNRGTSKRKEEMRFRRIGEETGENAQ